ncbi:MAG: hypothetical protein IPP40_13195 [bacterium]|nr:hypothetical protein [bacterium]
MLLHKQQNFDDSRPYLLRYSSKGVLLNSVAMDLSISPHKLPFPPQALFDKDENGGIWVGYWLNGLNIEHYDSELNRVHSIRDSSFEARPLAMKATPTGFLLAVLEGPLGSSVEHKLLRLDANGKLLSSITFPSIWYTDRMMYSSVNIEYIEPGLNGSYYLIGEMLLGRKANSIDTSLVYVAKVDSLGEVLWSRTCLYHSYSTLHAATVLSNGHLLFSVRTSDWPVKANRVVEITNDGEIKFRDDIMDKLEGNHVSAFVPFSNETLVLGHEYHDDVFPPRDRELFLISLDNEGTIQGDLTTGYTIPVYGAAEMSDSTLLVTSFAVDSLTSVVALIER